MGLSKSSIIEWILKNENCWASKENFIPDFSSPIFPSSNGFQEKNKTTTDHRPRNLLLDF